MMLAQMLLDRPTCTKRAAQILWAANSMGEEQSKTRGGTLDGSRTMWWHVGKAVNPYTRARSWPPKNGRCLRQSLQPTPGREGAVALDLTWWFATVGIWC